MRVIKNVHQGAAQLRVTVQKHCRFPQLVGCHLLMYSPIRPMLLNACISFLSGIPLCLRSSQVQPNPAIQLPNSCKSEFIGRVLSSNFVGLDLRSTKEQFCLDLNNEV